MEEIADPVSPTPGGGDEAPMTQACPGVENMVVPLLPMPIWIDLTSSFIQESHGDDN